MALEIRPVGGKRDLDVFIKLPWRLYRNERNWMCGKIVRTYRVYEKLL